MVDYGVTDTGFVRKPIDIIKGELEASLRAKLGDTLNLLPSSVFGQLIGIVSDREADVWELLEDVYASQYPSGARGQSLDNLCSLTGVRRDQATKSTVTLTCNLDDGVTLSEGRVVSQGEGSDVRFVTTAEVTNSTGAAADVYIEAEAAETGPLVAAAGTLTHIETPATGWNSVTNALDATVGRARQTDTSLLVEREQQLRITGKAALDAVVAEVGDVADVSAVTGFENDTDYTNGDGMPPKSIEILVMGGADQDIVDAIWASKGGGIATHGTESGTAIDVGGGSHTVSFSRPVEVDVWVDVEVTVDEDYPDNGDDQVKAAIAAWGGDLAIGDDVITAAMYAAVFQVSGVVDITKFWISTSDPPVGGDNITITTRQRAVFDTSRIAVTST